MTAVALPSTSSASLSVVPTMPKIPNPKLDRSQIIHTEPNKKGNVGGGVRQGVKKRNTMSRGGGDKKEHSGRRGGSGGPEVACRLHPVGVDAVSQRGNQTPLASFKSRALLAT